MYQIPAVHPACTPTNPKSARHTMQPKEQEAGNLVLLEGWRFLSTHVHEHDVAVHRTFISMAKEVIMLSHTSPVGRLKCTSDRIRFTRYK